MLGGRNGDGTTMAERKTSSSTPYFATEPPARDPIEAYWWHRHVTLRVLSELRHRRWGDPATAVAIAQVHAQLASGCALMALAAPGVGVVDLGPLPARPGAVSP